MGIDFNFSDGSAIFEVGLLVIVGLLLMACTCCGCSHCLEKPGWFKRREERKRMEKRKRIHKKRARKAKAAELEEERIARKNYWKERRANEKMAKKQAKLLSNRSLARKESVAESVQTLESVSSWYSGLDINSPDSVYGSEYGESGEDDVAINMEPIKEEEEEA